MAGWPELANHVSPLRGLVMSLAALAIGLVLALRTQWNTDGEPLIQWPFRGNFGVPSARFRRWFVRSAPVLVAVALGAFAFGVFVMR